MVNREEKKKIVSFCASFTHMEEIVIIENCETTHILVTLLSCSITRDAFNIKINVLQRIIESFFFFFFFTIKNTLLFVERSIYLSNIAIYFIYYIKITDLSLQNFVTIRYKIEEKQEIIMKLDGRGDNKFNANIYRVEK